MKVLFVCSGNLHNGAVNPLIEAQAESLRRLGLCIEYFTVKGKGWWGYLRNVPALRKLLRSQDHDILHAHYSLCGMVVFLAKLGLTGLRKPRLIVSLLGSDVNGSRFWRAVVRFFSRNCWDVTIVKSVGMRINLGLSRVEVVANGVDLDLFYHQDMAKARTELGLSSSGKIILFSADPERPVKNFALANEAMKLLATPDVTLRTLGKIPHYRIPLFLNAADVVLLTSKWEGSPNIIKEALACNRPVVTTDVGDVKTLLGDLPGCHLTEQNPTDIARKLDLALALTTNESGRDRIVNLKLDSRNVAEHLCRLYKADHR